MAEEKGAVKGTCDLCGLRIDGPPVVEAIGGEEKHFCCQGCARVYQVAYDNQILDQVVSVPQKPKENPLRTAIFHPGETAYFSLEGMWCAGCAVAAEQMLRSQEGVKEVDVSFAAERGRLAYDPELIDPSVLLKKLDGLGYRARNLTDPAEKKANRLQERTLLQLITAIAFGMQVMLLYLVQLYPRYAAGQFDDPQVQKIEYLAWLLATPVLLVGGFSFLRGAWRALLARTATMDTLVALGTISAYFYSAYIALRGNGEVYFDSVAMIVSFVMIGRYLEMMGGSQARKDVRNLLTIQPEQAWKQAQDDWIQVPAKSLLVGDHILVKPGERAPADAQILEGQAAVDESLLTGESLPANKEPGQTIFAGTIATDGAIVARVIRPVQETRLAQITRLVDHTLSIKPPVQRLADRASAYFAFGILAVAVATALGWILTGHPPAQAVLSAVAVLVVACPCALGLATPLALTVTLGKTTQSGILVRNPAALETASRVDRLVFDKTGTLTLGKMSVVDVQVDPAERVSKDELLGIAASVEQYSAHPVAKAILSAWKEPGQRPLPPSGEFQELRGLGASARLEGPEGRRVMVGSARFVEIDPQSHLLKQAENYARQGATVVWVGWEACVAGFIVLRDRPNPSATGSLKRLETHGIRTTLLSGDSLAATQAIAEELGLDAYEGGCSPAEKAARIRAWQQAGENVAMVGDGVNDAPALAQADLSIAMASGTDVAGETSDVLLTRADLTLIPWLVENSRSTVKIIRENLGWAFAYNLLVVPLAAFGFISPVIAAATMAFSSLLVVGNSLRLQRD